MADSDPLSSLTDAERSDVQQYISVTDQGVTPAIQQLRQAQWNVEVSYLSTSPPSPPPAGIGSHMMSVSPGSC